MYKDHIMSDPIDNGAEIISFIERIEQLEEEKKEKSDEIKEIKAEVKGRGYDTKVFAQILKLRFILYS